MRLARALKITAAIVVFAFSFNQVSYSDFVEETGLLFYLSGDKGFSADYSKGDPDPLFLNDISIIDDGAKGSAFSCPDFTQVMVYSAPGNIYAERGTISFFWRARTPFGKTPFHILQIPYCDHSTLDMIWLRLDYNGHGFDTFVTDRNLARTRVSYDLTNIPKPEQWIHLAVTWDENIGIRLYLDGNLIAKKDTSAVFDAGLEMIGMHGRLINPQYVRTEYNHTRGGDVDEIRIYDRMLDSEQISELAKCRKVTGINEYKRDFSEKLFQDEWLKRYGWDNQDNLPLKFDNTCMSVRKVEIDKVTDIKQQVWKANDGIRETTWPYPYNRSSLPGRTDYFIEPDWNCYSISGKTVTFEIPAENWNYVEITGAASGIGKLVKSDSDSLEIFRKVTGTEESFHKLDKTYNGGQIRFINDIKETPINEFDIFNVSEGKEPEGSFVLSYTVTSKYAPDYPCLKNAMNYIQGRFVSDERSVMVALPDGAPGNSVVTDKETAIPIIHILIPNDFRELSPFWSTQVFSYTWENSFDGLDGISIDIPALKVQPKEGGYFPLNLQIKDPLWFNRNLLDFSFRVKPGEPKTIWFDTRDRILSGEYPLYLTISGAGQDFTTASLEGAKIRLIFKNRAEASKEHINDRLAQVIDNWSNIVECGPNMRKFSMYDRFERDLTDLLRIDPGNEQGRLYWSLRNQEQGWPKFVQPKTPEGLPLWAFRQTEDLKLVKEFVLWWIDKRQIANGEFGGGLSDDGDLTNQWPGAALMGIEPEKIADSVSREMDAFYENGMFTNGLSTIQTDELHNYEEGISVLPQVMLLKYGDPKEVERIMATAKSLERITGINPSGHRHVRSSYLSGTVMAEEGVWAWTKPYSYLIFHPGLSLVEYNGNPKMKNLICQLMDGVLAHRKLGADGKYHTPTTINFLTDEDKDTPLGIVADYFWACWKWTGDRKYLDPLIDLGYRSVGSINANMVDILGKRESWGKDILSGVTPEKGTDLYRHISWQVSGNKKFLECMYADQIQKATQCMPMNTVHQWWVDRVGITSQELQRARLGGVALWRNMLYPGHAASWKFEDPAKAESVAILIPDAKKDCMTVVVYNLEKFSVKAQMTLWDILPGEWQFSLGMDENGDDIAEKITEKKTLNLERTDFIDLTFPPGKTVVIKLKLKKAGEPYWRRPDLGIGPEDVKCQGGSVHVRVHSLGSADTPEALLKLSDDKGNLLSSAKIPVIKAPLDLEPKSYDTVLKAPAGTQLNNCAVSLEIPGGKKEITKINNRVTIKQKE